MDRAPPSQAAGPQADATIFDPAALGACSPTSRYPACMTLPKEQLGNFVGMAIASLRGDINESAQRAKRLQEAVAHVAKARIAGEEALETSRAQRETREERLMRANDAHQRRLE
jgi:hypothetical protein